jgi:hypothetical protein
VNKPLGGSAGLYAAPEVLDPAGPNALTRVADVNGVGSTGTPGGPAIGGVAQLLVTGGDIAPDGRRVALRTYTDLYEWPVEDGDVAAALQGEPVVTALPSTFQGEGVAYTRDGTALLLTTEGEPAPVHRVPAADLGDGPPAAAGPGEGVAYTRDGTALLLTTEGEPAPVHRVPAADLGDGPPAAAGQGQGPAAEEPGGRVRTVVLAGGGVLALLVLAAAVRSRRRRPR